MPRSADDEQLLRGKSEEEAKTIGQVVLAALGVVVACFALFSLIAGVLIYLFSVFGVKKNWILYVLLPIALFGLLVIHGTGEWLSILGFMSWIQIPFFAPLAEQHLNQGQAIPITAYSFVGNLALGIVFANIAHPFIAYYRSKIVKSKHDGVRKRKKERDYQNFRLNRSKFLDKKQREFRRSDSKENFLGYDEYQKRVVIKDHEPNQHMFAVATTGGGKTVIIGANVENALRQNKPIIFMDGKGERKSMLEFKELCEKHGRRVHMFTDVDELSFNFLRHGSPTQLRDKVMNLFEWSEPFYKTNCSRYLQLVFRMLRDFDQKIDLETVYELTSKAKVAQFLGKKMDQAKIQIEVSSPAKPAKIAAEKKEPVAAAPIEPEKEEVVQEAEEPAAEESSAPASITIETDERYEPFRLSDEEVESLLQAGAAIPLAESEAEPQKEPEPKRIVTDPLALFGLEDEEPKPVEVEPSEPVEEPKPVEDPEPVEESKPVVEPEPAESPEAEASSKPVEDPEPEEHSIPSILKRRVSAANLFEGLADPEEAEEEVLYRAEWDEAMREKIQYYRERFFGIEDDEDESGFNFETLTSLRNQLAELIESDLGHLFEERPDGIDLKEITDRDEVAIFSLSGNKYKDYIKTLGRVVIMEVNTLVDYRAKAGKKSIMSVYDEFSAYVSHEVVDVINKSRSAGFECLLSVQGLSDIDAVDPILTRQIINNCNTYMIGRVNDPSDAEVLAAACGTYEDADITSQVEKKAFKNRFESEMGTVRMVQRYRAHPDEIRGLNTGEIFLCRKTIDQDGAPYVARVYVRNALDLTGIGA